MEKFRSLARHYLLADTTPLSFAERWRSALGALVGMSLIGLMFHAAMPAGSHWLIAPVGASAVILYAIPHSPLAQPWPVLGSFLVAALVGLVSSALIPVPQIAVAVALGVAIWLMARLNCLHPPGGAVALFIVLNGPYTPVQMGNTLGFIMLNVTATLLVAILVNNLLLGRRYPYTQRAAASLHKTGDASPLARLGLNHADLQSAVQTLDTFVDVKEDELVQLYNLAVDNAFNRHIGVTCGDIMSRDVVTVEFGTELEAAWTRLRAHRIKALPVVDSFGHLIGILTVADYLRQMDDTTAAGMAVRLQGLLKRTPGTTSEKAEVVGQIMESNVYAARPDTPITELVHRLSEKGHHHIPVVDDKRRVLGMVTQSDVIAALYKHVALFIA